MGFLSKNDLSIDIYIQHVDFDGYEATLYVSNEDGSEPLGEFILSNFVPKDFNVKEVIIGGYETPDYKEIIDEDLSVEDWWSEYDEKTHIIEANLTEHLFKDFKHTDPENEEIIKKVKINIIILE